MNIKNMYLTNKSRLLGFQFDVSLALHVIDLDTLYRYLVSCKTHGGAFGPFCDILIVEWGRSIEMTNMHSICSLN